MKFHSTDDNQFYVETPNGWDLYCRYPSNKSWATHPFNRVRTINYYRDYESARKSQKMTRKCYYFKDECWQKTRINPWACLPYLYCIGNRFIKLEKAPPVGFKCAEFPLSLRELRAKLRQVELDCQMEERNKYLENALQEQCNKKMKKKRPAA